MKLSVKNAWHTMSLQSSCFFLCVFFLSNNSPRWQLKQNIPMFLLIFWNTIEIIVGKLKLHDSIQCICVLELGYKFSTNSRRLIVKQTTTTGEIFYICSVRCLWRYFFDLSLLHVGFLYEKQQLQILRSWLVDHTINHFRDRQANHSHNRGFLFCLLLC
jgi:hypothetical protein